MEMAGGINLLHTWDAIATWVLRPSGAVWVLDFGMADAQESLEVGWSWSMLMTLSWIIVLLSLCELANYFSDVSNISWWNTRNQKKKMAVSFTTYRNEFTVRNWITFWIRNICYQKSVVSHFEWRWIWGKITASYTFSFFIFILVYLWKMYKYIFSYDRMVSEDRSEKKIEENNPRPIHGIFPASSCRK